MKTDVIIPAYRPGERFLKLVGLLERQTVPVNKIFVVNTQRESFERLADCDAFCQAHPKVCLRHIQAEEFDHGGTRDLAASWSDADILIFMTQDALPADEFLVERLIGCLLGREDTAAAYARQLPEKDCGTIERYTRQFNYPDRSAYRTKADLPVLGIKTYFCSNVCAAYRREVFERLGGFVKQTIFNEDMIFAARAVQAGYSIGYAADARVIHSHNYTGREQFSRNFDLGVSHAQYPEIFDAVPPEGEGKKLVAQTAAYLVRRAPWLLPRLVWQSGMKWLGYKLGRGYERLPRRLVRAFSMQKKYWNDARFFTK
ncbi:MAG: glycosyltransferase [Eubacteriales bacterium]|nr:glycosyltransferase [Eubacteriales bacterium]